MQFLREIIPPARALRDAVERGGDLIRSWLPGGRGASPDLSVLDGRPGLRARAVAALEEWNALLERLRAVDGDAFHVVLAGQQNSGKSTLANVLLGREAFAAADRIVTREIAEAVSDDGATYVDTPGFGSADAADARLCRESWERANVVLFLHSALLGGRDQKEEEDMLRELAASLPDAADRILVVCSKAGGRSRRETEAVMADLLSLARDVLGPGATVIAADALDFQAAAGSAHRERLETESGIPAIREWISLHRHMPPPAPYILERERERVLAVLREAAGAAEDAAADMRAEAARMEERLESMWRDARPAVEVAWRIRADERGGR